MDINNALAGIAVRNLPSAVAWYEQLLDRSADSRPMEEGGRVAIPERRMAASTPRRATRGGVLGHASWRWAKFKSPTAGAKA